MFTVNWRIKVNDTLPQIFWAEYMIAPNEWRRFQYFNGTKLFTSEQAARNWVGKLLAFEARTTYPLAQKRLK